MLFRVSDDDLGGNNMSFIETIYARAKANPQRVVVPECTNPSMMRAAVKAAGDGLAKITFVGDANTCK